MANVTVNGDRLMLPLPSGTRQDRAPSPLPHITLEVLASAVRREEEIRHMYWKRSSETISIPRSGRFSTTTEEHRTTRTSPRHVDTRVVNGPTRNQAPYAVPGPVRRRSQLCAWCPARAAQQAPA